MTPGIFINFWTDFTAMARWALVHAGTSAASCRPVLSISLGFKKVIVTCEGFMSLLTLFSGKEGWSMSVCGNVNEGKSSEHVTHFEGYRTHDTYNGG